MLHRDGEARVLAYRALAIREKLFGPDDARLMGTVRELCALHRGLGERDQAMSWARRAVAISERTVGADHPDTALALILVADTAPDSPEALPAAERAVAISVRSLAPDAQNLALAYLTRARALVALGRHREALADDERALLIREKNPDPEPAAKALLVVGEDHLALGEPAAAVPLHERAIAGWTEGKEWPSGPADARFALARALWASGARPRAQALAREAEERAIALGHDGEEARAAIATWRARR
jgi:tetratricopeptide (TPR) repeat protein